MTTSPVKILLVEDEMILAMDLADTLRNEGYQVVGIANNESKALQLFRRHTPDLAICDIHLQGSADGMQIVQQMKSIRPLPIIYLTAFTDAITFDKAKQTQPEAYLVKPYQLLTLRAAIELALHQFAGETLTAAETDGNGKDENVTISRDTILRIDETIFVKQERSFTKILLAQVLFVVAEGNYVVVHTTTSRYALRLSLAAFLEKVSYPRLVRTHRSYAVNVSKVDTFSDQHVTINNNVYPLSRQYRDDFLKSFVIR